MRRKGAGTFTCLVSMAASIARHAWYVVSGSSNAEANSFGVTIVAPNGVPALWTSADAKQLESPRQIQTILRQRRSSRTALLRYSRLRSNVCPMITFSLSRSVVHRGRHFSRSLNACLPASSFSFREGEATDGRSRLPSSDID